jgi:SAM-dependent methyltransferase
MNPIVNSGTPLEFSAVARPDSSDPAAVGTRPFSLQDSGETSAVEPLHPPRAEPLRLEPAQCCLCDEDTGVPVAVGEDFEYQVSPDQYLAMQCRGCGLVYLKLRPAMSELDRVYPPQYHAFDFSSEKYGLAHRARRWLESRRLLRWVRDLPAGARILDVGCGDGFHLGLLRDFGSPGWVLEGLDASERAARAGRARGFTVHLGTAQEAALPPESYDFALLIATIEHVDDPPAVLESVHRLLRPGGRLLIVTDNTDTLSFRLFATRHWGGYHFPRHWNLFNKDNLRRLARGTGFEVAHLDTILSPVNWTYSIHNLLVDRKAASWLVNRFTLASPISLGVFTVLDRVLQLAGRGGLVRAVLQKSITGLGSGSADDRR